MDSLNLTAGEAFGPGRIGVSSPGMSATLVGGTSSSDQLVTMSIAANPEAGIPTADLIGDPIDLSFSEAGDLYVLQYSYNDLNLPLGLAETAILPLVYHTPTARWIDATVLNSDGGLGQNFFDMSYADFLTQTDGEIDPLDLSRYGVDTDNNQAWVVLDYGATFGFGRFATAQPSVVAPVDDGDFDDEDLGMVFSAFTGPGLSQGPMTNPAADLSGDGDVDDEDLGLAFGRYAAPLSSSSVPEPASLAMLGVVGLMGAGSRRRRGIQRA